MNSSYDPPPFTTSLAHHAADPFRLLVESVVDYAIFLIDPAGKIASWNPGAERFTGYTAQEVIGKHFSIFYPRELLESGHAARSLQTALAQGRFEEETLQLRKEGTQFWAIVTLTALFDHFGTHVGFAKVTRDITATKRWQQALEESEERHRRLIEVIPDAVYVSCDDRLVFCNQAMLRLLGASSPEQLLGKSPFEIFHPKYHPAIRERIARMKQFQGSVPALEEEVVRLDGSIIPVEVVATCISYQGKLAFLVVLHDLTQRKRDEDRFGLLVEGVKDYAIYLMDAKGYVTSWNPGAERILGYSSEEAVKLHYTDFFTPQDVERGIPQSELERAAREGRSEDEGWRVRKDRSRFWANGVLTALFDGEGRLRGFGKVARDMTERRRTEAMLRSIVDNAIDGIVTIDEHGIVHSFNEAACKMFGYQASEIVGENVRILMPEPYHSEHDRYLSNYLRTGVAKVIGIGREVEGRHKDGSTFPIRLAISEFYSDDKRMFTGIIEDLTERNKLEEQLRQSQKMEAIGQLAGGVAHDFNNLLTIIRGYSELLLNMLPIGEAAHGMVSEILDAGERASSLTQQLLAFSRRSVLAPRILNLNDIVARTEKMLRRLIGEDIALSTVFDPQLRRIKVDPSQIEQVILNLVVNARDAMPRGGMLTIENRNLDIDEDFCRLHPECTPGAYVRLTVTDTGVGMPPEIKSRIFEPFFTTKPSGQGTGLGLATVFGIVSQSGGVISVYSEIGRGTSFRLLFPAVLEEGATPSDSGETLVRHGHEVILLVEDEDQVRKLARIALEAHGYQVLEASSGSEAIALAETAADPIHLVVTDVVMPHMSGRELVEELRQRFPGIKVLFVSGYTDDAIVRHGVLQETDSFLHKPFSPRNLARKIREVLDFPGPFSPE